MNNFKTDLTVAICAKQAQKTIMQCLESIERQSVKPDDIYVVLDDKNDPTIEEIKKRNIKIFISEKKALYNQRNLSLEKCRTQYLAFTDADCALDADWIKNILFVFKTHPEIAAGTGNMPSLDKHNFVSWLHYMFSPFIAKTGYTDSIVGGNSYFRVKVLKEVNGWSDILACNAEDVEISRKIIKKGYKIWFDSKIIAYHYYRKDVVKLFKCCINMGHGIAKMVKNERLKDVFYCYVMMIPVITIMLFFFIVTLNLSGVISILAISFVYLACKQRAVYKTIPHWFARWVLAIPYSVGIIKGFLEFEK